MGHHPSKAAAPVDPNLAWKHYKTMMNDIAEEHGTSITPEDNPLRETREEKKARNIRRIKKFGSPNASDEERAKEKERIKESIPRNGDSGGNREGGDNDGPAAPPPDYDGPDISGCLQRKSIFRRLCENHPQELVREVLDEYNNRD